MKFFCAAILSAIFCLPLRAEMADGVKAIVNDQVITFAEVEDFTAPAIETLRREYADQPDLFQQKLTDTLNDALEQLIERQLILHEYDTKYNKLPDSVIDELVQERIRERFGDRITFIKTLQAQGETVEKFREDVRDQFIVSEMRYKNLSQEKIIISPYKIEQYYLAHQDDFKVGDQIKLRMIVLNKTSAADKSTRELADEISTEIKNGAPFDQMLSVYSQDPHQKEDDGWIESSVLRKELADAAASLKPGQISGVIETPDTCYILRLDDKRAAHVKPLDDVRDEIENTLRAQEQKQTEQRWIESLKKKAFIRYF